LPGKIFINYRRGDDPGHTGRLFDHLQDSFAAEQLFLDVDNIAPGLDFVRVLNERVAECDILLAVIGKSWIESRDAAGSRRLDDPDDFVRIEIASALDQGKRVIPVLVGDAIMPRPEELPEAIRPLARRNAFRLTHERFRSDTQRLIKALELGLDEIETQQQAVQAEAKRQRREKEAEEQRRALEAEAARRAEKEAAARARATEEKLFASAKRAGTAAAIDAFLATHSTGAFTDEARVLKAALQSREGDFRRAMESNDATVLRSFLASYAKGSDADAVRLRLRQIEPRQGMPRAAVLVAGVLVLASLAGLSWELTRPPASSPPPSLADTRTAPTVQAAPPAQPAAAVPTAKPADTTTPPPQAVAPPPIPSPDQTAWDVVKDSSDESALKRFMAQYPDSPLYGDARARVAALEAERAARPPPPSPDEVAWQLLKDSSDDAALQRFITEYPKSSFVADAQARTATLAAAKPPQPSADETTWAFLKDTTDAAALKRFVAQYPNSAARQDAEARIAALETAAKASAPDPHELARSLQLELKRVGCFDGIVNGELDAPTKAAWQRFAKSTSSAADETTFDAVKAVRGLNRRICPLICPEGQRADGERCVAIAPPNPAPPPKRAAKDAAPATSGVAALCATYVYPRRHPECPGYAEHYHLDKTDTH
jgi:hypothetical protein